MSLCMMDVLTYLHPAQQSCTCWHLIGLPPFWTFNFNLFTHIQLCVQPQDGSTSVMGQALFHHVEAPDTMIPPK